MTHIVNKILKYKTVKHFLRGPSRKKNPVKLENIFHKKTKN